MQLPTSLASYTPTNSSYSNRPTQRTEPLTTDKSIVRQDAEQRAFNSSNEPTVQSSQVEKTAVVEQPAKTELSAQDLTSRQQRSGNPSIDQYQQIALQGESNAKSQDPSLFRVDVYV